MNKLSRFGVRTFYLMQKIKIKRNLNLSLKVNLQDHNYGLILI